MQLKTYSRFFALHITLFVLQLNLHGQTAAWQWINGGGGSGYASSNQTYPDPDNANQSAIDSKGNIIAGGEVTSSPKFGAVTVPNLFGNWGGGTMFLTKYNSCGD